MTHEQMAGPVGKGVHKEYLHALCDSCVHWLDGETEAQKLIVISSGPACLYSRSGMTS